ncbi:anti-sigma-I factor RsgI family protein [Clostridium sp.]
MNKTGIVISVLNRKAGIMTDRGEFVYIKFRKVLPKVGEIHTGELYKKIAFVYKYIITAASLMFICISSVVAHAYYTPVTSLVLSINPSISIEANRWNKIISSKALDSDGSLILNNVVLNNKSIDDGLELLVKEAKAKNFINDKYIDDKKIINVHIKSTKDISIDVSNFKDIIDSNKLNIKINVASENNKNIDIIVNNKKWDIVNTPINKPSVEINTTIKEDNPPTIKEGNKESINKDNKIDKHVNKDKDIKTENKILNKKNDTPPIIKKSDNSSKTYNKFQLDKNKKVQLHNNNYTNFEKHSYEIQKNKNANKNSSNYESQKTTDNSLNKFFKDFNN